MDKNTRDKTLCFRVTENERKKIKDTFGSVANMRDFILEAVCHELEAKNKKR